MRRYSYGWLTVGFFLVSILGHWIFGWFAFVDEQKSFGHPVLFSSYAIEMTRDTFENWQSEFLQLIWQVVGLAYFLYIGSPASKESGDRREEKIDLLIRMVGGQEGEKIREKIDGTHFRTNE